MMFETSLVGDVETKDVLRLCPPQPFSPIAPLRNTSRHSLDSNNQRNASFSPPRNITNGSNSSPRCSTGSNFAVSRRSSNRISTTRPVATRENESPTINCIKITANKLSLIPDIVNKNTEIPSLCDPFSDVTVIQQSCVQVILSFSLGLIENSRLLITK
ncbi:hypothetical protein AVEN_149089-1 [Araneus ventricosus]|uniref:Uncharacterized protein n=1 Tax=Araneus ventricosus TaxID=182803 RepID=A0A4Y2TWM1_ARAVE|nr:hypothetical protein AVEN_149089-1 [Araneus ventricosus]